MVAMTLTASVTASAGTYPIAAEVLLTLSIIWSDETFSGG